MKNESNRAESSAPLQSMTGYALKEIEIGGTKFRMHLKSVNHRYFDWKWRAPRGWTSIEVEARALVQARLQRGSVECTIEEAGGGAESSSTNGAQELFAKMQKALDRSREVPGLKIPGFVRALILARFPDAWMEQSSSSRAALGFDQLKSPFESLSSDLLSSRLAEGAKTRVVLQGCRTQLAQCLSTIEGRLPELKQKLREGFEQRLNALATELRLPEPQENRLLQEYALLLERRDVSEETSRIHMHLESLEQLLAKGGPQAGKKLEFLLQELHREWTTLGNKIQDPRFTQPIMDAKLELDRMKEQAANLA